MWPRPGAHQARRAAEAALQGQRGNEARERAALRTILDTKMRGLVAELGRGLAELPPGVSPDILITLVTSQTHGQLAAA